MADEAKVREERSLRIEALKFSTQQSWIKLKMDPIAFSKMSLRDRSPIASAATKNISLSGPAIQNHVKPQENEQNSRHRPRRRGNRKRQEQDSATRLPVTKSTLSISENEDDGGVLLNAALTSVPAEGPARSNVPPKPTDVNISALNANRLVTSAYMPATNTHVPATLTDYSATTAHQAAKATIKLMKQERHKAIRDSKPVNMSRSSNSTMLNPTAPIYQPTNVALPLGIPGGYYGQSAQRFTPYEPVRSDPVFRVLPPWRIDKISRFSSTAALRSNTLPTTTAPRAPLAVPGPISVAAPVSSITSLQQPLTTSSEVKERNHIRKGEQTLSQRLAQNARNAAPEPEAAYVLQASRSPTRISSPHNLLLVLDLNGTLIYRKTPSIYFTPRPFLSHFLKYCLTNHSVMIWSSARPENVKRICEKIFSLSQRQHVIAEWARDTLELSKADFFDKVQVYKRLDRIWDNVSIQKKHPQYAQGGKWSQANTVLIDDSMYKAAKQPYNHLEIPEFLGPTKSKQDDVLGQVVAYLEEAKRWDDISCFIKQTTFTMNAGQSWDWYKGQRVAPEGTNGALGARGELPAMQ